MIAEYRRFAEKEYNTRLAWKKIVDASDEELIVETYVGVHVMNKLEEVK